MSGNVRGARLSQNNELFTYFRCEGFFREKGSVIGQNLFSIDEMTISVTTETLKKDNNQFAIAKQGALIPLSSTVEGNITFGSLSEFAMRSALNSADSDGYLAQAAVADGTYTVATAAQKKNGIYQIMHPVSGLPIQNLSGISAVWGTDGTDPVAPVEGTDYTVDRRTGVVELLVDKPAEQTVAGNFVLTYDAAQILAAKKLLRMGIGSAPGGKRGSMHFLALNEQGLQVRVDLWDVFITPDGGVSFQASSEFSTSKAKLSLQAVQFFDGKPIPAELAFGQVQELDDAALAA